jgi:triosephosphate isomerase
MRKQYAAANWKMNCTYLQGKEILHNILKAGIRPAAHQQVIFSIPFPYLIMAKSEVAEEANYTIAAQNCHQKKSGAYTGEISAEMLHSIGINYCIVGHSERREYFNETNQQLAEKVNVLLEYGITPIFCCGEPLAIREAGSQNAFVEQQLKESLFHLNDAEVSQLIIAYEPIWAIGTGKTATTEQAQQMHAHLRSILSKQYGKPIANDISILYGGSVKAANATEIFTSPDVDGGLVGGASLQVQEFIAIIKALK